MSRVNAPVSELKFSPAKFRAAADPEVPQLSLPGFLFS
jgi:hypothetical protein